MQLVICPNCGNQIKVHGFAPAKVKCKNCKASFDVEYEDENGTIYPGGLKGFPLRHPKLTKALGWTAIIAILAGLVALFIKFESDNHTTSENELSATENSPEQSPDTISTNSSPVLHREVTETESPTEEEQALLDKLHSGALDGLVGEPLWDNGYGSTIQLEIRDGTPIRNKYGPGGKFFDGKENESWNSHPRVDIKWRTDDEQLFFLKKYGFLSNDPDVKAYSAKYKGKV